MKTRNSSKTPDIIKSENGEYTIAQGRIKRSMAGKRKFNNDFLYDSEITQLLSKKT